jgi:hypothetical protein
MNFFFGGAFFSGGFFSGAVAVVKQVYVEIRSFTQSVTQRRRMF